MNKLPIEKRVQIIHMLVEGNTLRSTSRMADVSINTVTKLLLEVGAACELFHNEKVVNVKSERIECDEIWSFVYAKEKNDERGIAAPEKAGDVWTWMTLDADSKLIVSWLATDRGADSANVFMNDVADRLANRVQLITDGHRAYLSAVYGAFQNDIDFAQQIKIYSNTNDNTSQTEKKYSHAECTGYEKHVISREPNKNFISTSYLERQNLNMRTQMRRFTRLTIAISRKIENHCCAIALHFVYYNFAKVHKSLSVTPAMQAGLTKKAMTIQDIVMLADYPAPTTRGNYKKNIS